MCNRFRSIREWSEIPRTLYRGSRLNFAFNPNVAPTELVPVFVARPDGPPSVVIARFGISDGPERGQFRSHLKARRCVIPAQGFYEWRDEGGKQPYYFSRKDGAPLMLAGTRCRLG